MNFDMNIYKNIEMKIFPIIDMKFLYLYADMYQLDKYSYKL